MKTVAFGLAALIGLALPAAAGSKDQIQFAQAMQDSADKPARKPVPPRSPASKVHSRASKVRKAQARSRASKLRSLAIASSPATAKGARVATACSRPAQPRPAPKAVKAAARAPAPA